MKTVLREEWKAGRARIKITSIVLAVILLGSVLVNVTAYRTGLSHVTFFGSFLYIFSLILGTVGIPVYALVRGSGNIRSLLFDDTNYLLLLLPKRSYVLLGGRQLMNLAEFCIYFIPSLCYLSLLGPTGGLLWNWFGGSLHAGTTYWHNVSALYRELFIEYPAWTVQTFLMVLISFAAVQATLNCAFAIYASFVHSKKPHKFLMALIIFFLFYLEVRVSTWGMNRLLFTRPFYAEPTAAGAAWFHVGILAAFGTVYFLLTGWLLENRIEV
ncbi:MAG: hypothetical protein LKF96_04520 [Treponema sp.]|jgi:hypothetical protein|nr:hypothetical protein [Treponema sp.]